MRGAITPLPQYACMAWCSVEGTGIIYLLLCVHTDGNSLSSFSVALYAAPGRPGFDSRQRLGIYLFATASRPALGPIQPPMK
jgi:hypothetical protein